MKTKILSLVLVFAIAFTTFGSIGAIASAEAGISPTRGDIHQLRGRVVANRYASIVDGIPQNIAIDNQSPFPTFIQVELDAMHSGTFAFLGGRPNIPWNFIEADSNVGAYLGKIINFTVYDDGSNYIVLSASIDETRNAIQIFDIEDLEPVLPAFNQLSFSRGGMRATNVNLTNDVIVIYNGRAVAADQVINVNNPSVFSPNAYSIWGNARANGTITTVAVSGSGNRADLIIITTDDM